MTFGSMFELPKPSLKGVLPAELNISYADSVQSPFVGELLDLLAPQFEEQLRQYKGRRWLHRAGPSHNPGQTSRPPPFHRCSVAGSPYGPFSSSAELLR